MKAQLALLLIVTALMCSAAPSRAAGVNLSWNACTPEGGVQNRTFACNTNLGSRTLFASFILASDFSNAVGFVARVDITAEGDSLPAWWRFDGPNTCRTGLSASFGFASDPNTICVDPLLSQATGALAGYRTVWTNPQVPGENPATAQALVIAAVREDQTQTLIAGTEYYAFKLTLNSSKTVGTGACAGCSTPVCLTVSEIEVDGSGNTTQVLTDPIVASTATWQSPQQCPGSFAALNVTWGQIRSVLK